MKKTDINQVQQVRLMVDFYKKNFVLLEKSAYMKSFMTVNQYLSEHTHIMKYASELQIARLATKLCDELKYYYMANSPNKYPEQILNAVAWMVKTRLKLNEDNYYNRPCTFCGIPLHNDYEKTHLCGGCFDLQKEELKANGYDYKLAAITVKKIVSDLIV